MSKFGTVGKVRFWIKARVVVNGEPGTASSGGPLSVGGGVAVGPCEGPLTGPWEAEGCSRGGGGAEGGSGAGAGATVAGMLVNSILVAVEALWGHL
jgi:hypothetical protein